MEFADKRDNTGNYQGVSKALAARACIKSTALACANLFLFLASLIVTIVGILTILGIFKIPYLSYCFSRSVYVWEHSLTSELIMSERPDIVVDEIDERNIHFLIPPSN